MTNTQKSTIAINLFLVNEKLTTIHLLQAEQETLFNETIDLLCEIASTYEETPSPQGKHPNPNPHIGAAHQSL